MTQAHRIIKPLNFVLYYYIIFLMIIECKNSHFIHRISKKTARWWTETVWCNFLYIYTKFFLFWW